MKRIGLYLCSCLLLSGCASYELTEEVKQMSASMSRERALKTIESQLHSTSRQLGMCYHHIYPKPATHRELVLQPVEMEGQVIEVKYVAAEVPDDVKKIISSALAKAGTAPQDDGSERTYRFNFDVSDLARVFVAKENRVPSCQGKPGGTLVQLQNNQPTWGVHIVAFHLAPENVDVFLAAVRALAPGTPIRVPPL